MVDLFDSGMWDYDTLWHVECMWNISRFQLLHQHVWVRVKEAR